MPRSIDDLIAHADEIADIFERYEPQGSDAAEPALIALRRAAYRRSLVEREVLDSVRRARDEGASWATIGAELGTTGEAARQRYGSRLDA
jgi:hypothetical protein